MKKNKGEREKGGDRKKKNVENERMKSIKTNNEKKNSFFNIIIFKKSTFQLLLRSKLEQQLKSTDLWFQHYSEISDGSHF